MAEDTLVASPPPPPPPGRHRRSTGDRIRLVLRGAGQVLITLGLVVLLFVVYEVWITNIFADREQAQAQAAIQKVFDNPNLSDPLQLPGTKANTIPIGAGIANLYLPRLGPDYVKTIVEGSTNDAQEQDALEKGPTRYPGTAKPGQPGNFAVAGHRVGKGEPFLNLDKLQAGDPVIVETKTDWFVYRVKGLDHGLMQPDNIDDVPGREIVNPSDGQVLDSWPNHPGKMPPDNEALMTMTTCHPKFTAAKRMIVFSVLTATYKVQFVDGKRVDAMPPQVKQLYQGISV